MPRATNEVIGQLDSTGGINCFWLLGLATEPQTSKLGVTFSCSQEDFGQ